MKSICWDQPRSLRLYIFYLPSIVWTFLNAIMISKAVMAVSLVFLAV